MSQREPEILISTSAGTYRPKPLDSYTLRDVLAANGLAATMFQAYLGWGDEMRAIPVDVRVSTAGEGQRFVLQCNRNPDFNQIAAIEPPPEWGAEAVVSLTTAGTDPLRPDSFAPQTVGLSAEEAREAVAERVSTVLERVAPSGTVVAGLSGGGDSNAMATGLARWRDRSPATRAVQAFTLVYDPIWPDAGTDRAVQLSTRYRFLHTLIDETGMERLLHVRTSLTAFYADFLSCAGSATTHVFATYLISAVARRWLRSNVIEGERLYCLGFNREDVLADVLFALINGNIPLAYPVRRFGDCALVMPAWELPKALLDACFPDYSATNYSERLDHTTRSRALVYHLSHALDSAYPAFGLSLLEGVRRTFDGRFAELQPEEYDLHVAPGAGREAREAMLGLCAKHLMP